MIFDTLENIELYIPLLPQLKTIASAMDHDDVYDLKPGHYATPDKNVSYDIYEYNTSSAEKPFEFHKNTTVFEAVLSGNELMSTSWRELKNEALSYDAKTDTGMFKAEPLSAIQASQGRFVVFFPGEPFKTGISIAESDKVRKIIFKVSEK